MAIRYDPLLIARLARQARGQWTGRRVEGLWLDRDRREAWLVFADGSHEDRAVGFLLHPTSGFIIATPTVPPEDPLSGRRIAFRKLFVTAVEAPVDERLIVVELAGGLRDVHTDLPPVFRLYVELQTNQWNALLTRGSDDAIEAVLWPRTAGARALRPGAIYARPEGARDWAGRCPDTREWSSLLLDHSPDQRRRVLLQSAAWSSALNVDWVLGDASTSDDPASLAAALERYRNLRDAPSDEAWLLSRGETAQPYPLPLEAGSGPYAGLLEAMYAAASQASVWPRDDDPEAGVTMPSDEAREAVRLEGVLREKIKGLERRRSALGRQLEGESAEHLRELGHLLLARQSDIPRGAANVSLEGFEGSRVQLELDPRLNAVQNAERYYERARRRDRAARALPGRLARITDRISRLETGLASLREAGPTAELWSLVGGRPESGGSESGPRGGPAVSPVPHVKRPRSPCRTIGPGQRRPDVSPLGPGGHLAARPPGGRLARDPEMGAARPEPTARGPGGGSRPRGPEQRGAAQWRRGRGLDSAKARPETAEGAPGSRRSRASHDPVRRARSTGRLPTGAGRLNKAGPPSS